MQLFAAAAAAFRDAAQAFNQPQGAPRSNRTNLKAPDTFDGQDPTKLRSFIVQCVLHFAERAQDFPSDDDKIFYAMSYLRGKAQEHFAPMIHDPVPPVWDGNWDLFAQELHNCFGPLDPIGDAEDGITQLKMKSGARVHEYNLEFDLLASYLSWNDDSLRYHYYRGLADRIKNELVSHSYVNTVVGIREEARRIDARYWKRELEKQREREMAKKMQGGGGGSGGGSGSGQGKTGSSKNSSNTGNANQSSGSGQNRSGQSGSGTGSGSGSGSGSGGGSGNQQNKGQNKNSGGPKGGGSSPKKPYQDKLTKGGKLTTEERERRTKNNLCMYCGESGHQASDCPKRKTPAQGRAATTEAPKPDAPPKPEESKN